MSPTETLVDPFAAGGQATPRSWWSDPRLDVLTPGQRYTAVIVLVVAVLTMAFGSRTGPLPGADDLVVPASADAGLLPAGEATTPDTAPPPASEFPTPAAAPTPTITPAPTPTTTPPPPPSSPPPSSPNQGPTTTQPPPASPLPGLPIFQLPGT